MAVKSDGEAHLHDVIGQLIGLENEDMLQPATNTLKDKPFSFGKLPCGSASRPSVVLRSFREMA
jgi:hypothetical protein